MQELPVLLGQDCPAAQSKSTLCHLGRPLNTPWLTKIHLFTHTVPNKSQHSLCLANYFKDDLR